MNNKIDWVIDFEEFMKEEGFWNEYVKNTEKEYNINNIYKILYNEIENANYFISEAFTWINGNEKEKWDNLDTKWIEYMKYWS